MEKGSASPPSSALFLQQRLTDYLFDIENFLGHLTT
jgi:hypothetical protein